MKSNKLDLRHEAKGNIYGFPKATVSDLFVAHVNKLVHGQKVNHDDIGDLNSLEQGLFNRLLHVTGVNGSFQDGPSLASMKDRLKLVEGEIVSGNDSPHLLVELREILVTLARQNVITKAEQKRFLFDMSTYNK